MIALFCSLSKQINLLNFAVTGSMLTNFQLDIEVTAGINTPISVAICQSVAEYRCDE